MSPQLPQSLEFLSSPSATSCPPSPDKFWTTFAGDEPCVSTAPSTIKCTLEPCLALLSHNRQDPASLKAEEHQRRPCPMRRTPLHDPLGPQQVEKSLISVGLPCSAPPEEGAFLPPVPAALLGQRKGPGQSEEHSQYRTSA